MYIYGHGFFLRSLIVFNKWGCCIFSQLYHISVKRIYYVVGSCNELVPFTLSSQGNGGFARFLNPLIAVIIPSEVDKSQRRIGGIDAVL